MGFKLSLLYLKYFPPRTIAVPILASFEAFSQFWADGTIPFTWKLTWPVQSQIMSSGVEKIIPSLKRTNSTWKMDGWNISSIVGWVHFQGLLLLVSGGVNYRVNLIIFSWGLLRLLRVDACRGLIILIHPRLAKCPKTNPKFFPDSAIFAGIKSILIHL